MTKVLILIAVFSLAGLSPSYGADDPKRDQAMEEALQSVMLKEGQSRPQTSVSEAGSVPIKPKKPPRRSLFGRLF